MPITLNHSNISVQYSSDKSYIIENVKSDLYLRDSRIGISSNLTAEPVVIAPAFTETIRTFTHSGGTEEQTTHTITIAQNTICDILMIGGGGSGGANDSGGGGAGACIVAINQTFTAGSYTIRVGKGGIGGSFSSRTSFSLGTDGYNSSIFNQQNNEIYRAIGGGRGGGLERSYPNYGQSANDFIGKNGGCGGGGGFFQGGSDNGRSGGSSSALNIVNGISNIGPGVSSSYGVYGKSGGSSQNWTGGNYSTANAAGGGGIGTAGSPGSASTNRSGVGGDGLDAVTINSITYNFKNHFANGGAFGINGYIGGGGGGGAYSNSAAKVSGGLGGGGIGDNAPINTTFSDAPTNGFPNTGSGGGGASADTPANGGNGGSGIVIIKFKSTTPILEGITHKRLNFSYNNDNLIAWYKFNGDYLDSSGNGHNLTNVGTVIQSTQIIEGQAVEFDSTDYLEFPATINPYTIWNNGKGITFSCWVRFTAHETWARILDFQSAVNTSTGFYIAVKTNWSGIPAAILMNIAEVTTFSYSNWSNSVLTNLGVWHHIVWSIDVNGKWDVYLNNVRINNTETLAIPNITYNVRYINKSAFSGDGTWDGQMDDFRIYDRALSATDVAMLYNKTYPIPNLYTLNFPVPTIADINNNSNIVLRGAYDIALSTTNAIIIPKSNQYILKPTTFSTSNLSLSYHLLNPILDPIGAQWTYSSNNTNVYHMGCVGIGTTSPEYNLDVRGAIYSSSGGYKSSTLTKWSVLSDRRIKENIVKASYDKCLDNVKNIELYNFNFKDNCVNTNDKHQLGFIAQEVQQVYPKAVEVSNMIMNLEQKIDDLLTLNITQIDYTLYGAVKSLIEKIENIKIKMEHIKTTYDIP
jgi:hypothetical protein